jgi:hypothetical protein
MSYLAPKWNGGGKGWYSPALKCVLAGGMRCDGRRRHRQESVHTGEGQECATDTERRKNLTWCGGSPREVVGRTDLDGRRVAWRGHRHGRPTGERGSRRVGAEWVATVERCA